jgi:cysteine desulfurase
MIYLDNNATTRLLPEVVDVMERHWRESFANPGSRHAAGRRARQILETARESMAAILGAHPEEVIFTSGGTESNNMAVLGLTAGTPGTIALTAGEHPAVMETCRFLESKGWRLALLPVDKEGLLVPLPPLARGGQGRSGETANSASRAAPQAAGLARAGSIAEQSPPTPPYEGGETTTQPGGKHWNPELGALDDLRLFTVILAHNETGVVQDLGQLAAACRAREIPVHVDAVQAVGKISVNFHQLGVTSLALGAHKFYGPRGIGALLLKRGKKLAPSAFGGHQESGRRPGTECVALIAGMAKALELFHSEQELRMVRTRELRDRLEARLAARCSPVLLNGSREQRLPNTLNVAFPGADGEALLVALDLEDIACSLGSTCASGSAEPAPVLLAMNRSREVWHSSVRFSVGIETTLEEIDEAAERIAATVNRLRGT